MSEFDNADESNRDANAGFDTQFGALLADPTMWESPSDDLSDRIVSAISSESVNAPEPSAVRSGSHGP